MIEPKEIIVNEKKFIIHKFPAVAGMEIVIKAFKATQNNIDYQIIEEVIQKGMKFIGVSIENIKDPLMLTTQSLIDNHVKDWEMLGQLIIELMDHNCSFFPKGRLSNLLKDFALKVKQ